MDLVEYFYRVCNKVSIADWGGEGLGVEVSESRVHVVGKNFLDGGNCERTVIFLPHFLL